MRWDVINELLKGRGSYLEIGVSEGRCGARISAVKKWGVDPVPRGRAVHYFDKFFTGTSDAFFGQLSAHQKFDVVFIDGLHHAEQVYRDVLNALRHLSERGVIVLHDCNPLTHLSQHVPRRQDHWNGDCWKAIAMLRVRHPELNAFVIRADEGLGIVCRARRPVQQLVLDGDPFKLVWDNLYKERERILGLVEPSVWQGALHRAEQSFSAVTAIFGGKDRLQPLRCGVRAICVTDGYAVEGWQIRALSGVSELSPRLKNRYVKVLIHKFADSDIVLYVDGSFQIVCDPTDWALTVLGSSDFAAFAHPSRRCAYDEAAACIKADRGDPNAILRQMSRYRAEGFPVRAGLHAGGILIRRMTPQVRDFGEAWWKEIRKGSERDQLSLSYVAWKTGMRIRTIPGHVYRHELFKFRGHVR